jgi:hypothetical protein
MEDRSSHILSVLSLYNSYMIYIIRNPILWLGISAYGGGVLSVYFSIDDVHRTTFFVMKTKWRFGFPIIKKDKRNNVYC